MVCLFNQWNNFLLSDLHYSAADSSYMQQKTMTIGSRVRAVSIAGAATGAVSHTKFQVGQMWLKNVLALTSHTYRYCNHLGSPKTCTS